MQEKFEEYRKLCEIDLRNYEQCSILAEEQGIEIKRLQEEVRHLEEQGNLFLRRIAEKEDRIKEVEALAKKAVEDERREHDKKAQTL